MNMAKYRNDLPLHKTNQIFLSEGGQLTDFFFNEETKDIKIPECDIFFNLIKDEKVMKWSKNYNRKFMDLILKENSGFGCILTGFLTRKARKDDVREHLGIGEPEWIKMNTDYIQFLDDLRQEYEKSVPDCPPILINGVLLPQGGKGDTFSLTTKMTIKEAEEYHKHQINVLAEHTKVDFLLVGLVSYPEEAIAICNVAAKVKLPVVLSFTTEMDGCLISGESVKVLYEKITFNSNF